MEPSTDCMHLLQTRTWTRSCRCRPSAYPSPPLITPSPNTTLIGSISQYRLLTREHETLKFKSRTVFGPGRVQVLGPSRDGLSFPVFGLRVHSNASRSCIACPCRTWLVGFHLFILIEFCRPESNRVPRVWVKGRARSSAVVFYGFFSLFND